MFVYLVLLLVIFFWGVVGEKGLTMRILDEAHLRKHHQHPISGRWNKMMINCSRKTET